MGSGQHATAVDEIDRIPKSRGHPSSTSSRRGCSCSNATTSRRSNCRDAILRRSSQGSQESDYALLNLMTCTSKLDSAERSQSLAERLRETTTNEQLRLIAEAPA